MNITEQDGKGNVTYYKYFREDNKGKLVIDDNGTLRAPSMEEHQEYFSAKAAEKKAEEIEVAKAAIEQAKQSDNPEIASLAEAFSKLLEE